MDALTNAIIFRPLLEQRIGDFLHLRLFNRQWGGGNFLAAELLLTNWLQRRMRRCKLSGEQLAKLLSARDGVNFFQTHFSREIFRFGEKATHSANRRQQDSEYLPSLEPFRAR